MPAPPSNAPASPVAIGDVLAGKYRVERVLGVGGMGVVVAATHITLEQLVALKFVLPSAIEDSVATERFLREARAAVRLRSDHVTKVLDVGTLESGAPYMVMEYLEGQDLGNYIRDHGALPVGQVADLVIQACEALAEAHSLGIVHRDLKPQNLFVTRDVGGREKIKVLDFGISKTSSPGNAKLTQTSNVMGSPLYMAPEQMRSSKNADARIDVWALGIVLFELLTGQVPFEADTMPELCLKVVGDEPRAITDFRQDVPADMLAVIAKCLQKNPADRYANAAEIAVALAPLASPIASEIVSRALSAVSLAGPTMVIPAYPPAESRPMGSAAPTSVVVSPAPSAQPATTNPNVTDRAWGTTSAPPAPSRTPLILLGGVALAAIGVAAFFATRKPPAAMTAVEATTAKSPPVTAAPLPPPAATPTQTQTGDAVVTPVTTPPASASVTPPPAPSPKTPGPRPIGTPKPSTRDDGIPSVR